MESKIQLLSNKFNCKPIFINISELTRNDKHVVEFFKNILASKSVGLTKKTAKPVSIEKESSKLIKSSKEENESPQDLLKIQNPKNSRNSRKNSDICRKII